MVKVTLQELAAASTKSERSSLELASKSLFVAEAKKKKQKKTGATRVVEEESSMSVPVSAVTRARVSRKEGYEKAKGELEEWEPFVRAEARSDDLRFGDRRRVKPQAPRPLSDEKLIPSVREEAVVEETGERAKTRSVLFHADQKNKYHAKNSKSKAFQKNRRKKKRERAQAEREAAAKDDPELKQQMEEELATKRVEERMVLRHASSSAWAKSVKKRGRAAVDSTSDARRSAHALNQQLKEKNQVEDDDEDDDDRDEALEKSKVALSSEGRKVESMDFMLRAAKDREKAKRDFEDLEEEVMKGDPEDEVDEPFRGSFEPGSLQLKTKAPEDAWLRAIEIAALPQKTPMKDEAPLEKAASSLEKSETLGGKASLEGKEKKKKKRSLRDMSQADLVDLAFDAGDAEDFAKEKEAAETEETPAAVTDFVAGWGSWTGEGAPLPKKAKKIVDNKKKKIEFPENHPSRSPHVILNPKIVKNQTHLKVAQVPYPFTSKASYEKYMATPLGREWNHDNAMRILTRPAVNTRPGVAIPPIKKVARPGG